MYVKSNFFLGKGGETNMPEYLWVIIYVTKIQPISNKCREFVEIDDKVALMVPMIYVGHRRDRLNKRASVRV